MTGLIGLSRHALPASPPHVVAGSYPEEPDAEEEIDWP
jgi:hypothetical protein